MQLSPAAGGRGQQVVLGSLGVLNVAHFGFRRQWDLQDGRHVCVLIMMLDLLALHNSGRERSQYMLLETRQAMKQTLGYHFKVRGVP